MKTSCPINQRSFPQARSIFSPLLICVLSAAFLLNLTTASSQATKTIWPLGDSITDGFDPQPGDAPGGGYRTEAYLRLIAAGINFSYVGSWADNPSAILYAAGANYTSHDGHDGYTVAEIDGNLTANDGTTANNGGFWITGGNGTGRGPINPSIVLLEIGGNNVSVYGTTAGQIYAMLTNLLDDLKADLPNAQIFVASLVPRADVAWAESTSVQYSALIAANLSSFGPNFHFVDLHSNFPTNGLGPDGIHPNLVGYDWMGDQWANAIIAYLGGGGGSAPVITSATIATGTVGRAFSYQITASNNPTSYNAAGLPAGLSVNTGSGLISGTPTTVGTNSATISASNASGTGTAALTLIVGVAGIPAITSPITVSGAVGSAFSYQITASNGPTSYNATGLPAGLSVNTGSGLISGTPTTAGTNSVIISASNANGTGSNTLTLIVNAAGTPAITSSTTAFGTVGGAFSYQITASNSPTNYNAAGLPAGLSVNTSSGVISGTPTTVGTSSVTISASNANGTGSVTLTLTINPASSGTGAVIGIDFDVGGASGQSPGSTAVAGPAPTAGWNNNADLNNPPTAYVPYNPYNPSDTGAPLTLMDNTGATTTGTFGFNNYGFSTLNGGSTYSPGYGATGAVNGGYTPDQQLYNGAAQAAYGGYVQQITLRNIPYAQFDVYVLVTAYANVSGDFGEGSVQLFSGSASVTAGPTYYFGSGSLAGTVPSTYMQATSTDQQNPTMGADYALFSGLTGGAGTTYSFDLSAPGNSSSSFNSAGAFISAVEIVQIVSVSEPNPIPLNISYVGGNTTLTWTNSVFNLQSATNVGGPYTTVLGAVSGYIVPAGGGQKFYRLYWSSQ